MADGKKENQTWAGGKKFYPGKEKSGPANIFLLPPKPSAPADPTIHCEAGWRRLDWRQLWREGPRLRRCSPATSLDFKQEPPPLQLGSTGRGDRATPRQAREGPEDLGEAPPACTLALSRPLATSQNKLFNLAKYQTTGVPGPWNSLRGETHSPCRQAPSSSTNSN